MTRTVVIAGTGPLLGATLARRLVTEGCRVGLFARSEAFVADLAAELDGGPGAALAVPTDVTDPDAVAAGFDTVREAFGPVEAVVLNQSAPGGGSVAECDPAAFERTWRVRTLGSHLCVRAALDGLRETDGTVIASGTNFATRPTPDQVEWASAAAATRGLLRSLDTAEPNVQAVYVAIRAAVAPPESTWPGAIGADAVAETYWRLIEQECGMTTDLDLRAPGIEPK